MQDIEEQTSIPTSRIMDMITEYIDESKIKGNYHIRNANAANHWDAFLNVFSLTLTAGLALSVTLLTVYNAGSINIAITSGVFAFFIGITQRLNSVFNFQFLRAVHHHSSDDYYECHYLFKSLLRDLEKGEFDIKKFDIYTWKYIGITQKSHLQPIKDCIFCCLCFFPFRRK